MKFKYERVETKKGNKIPAKLCVKKKINVKSEGKLFEGFDDLT
jgi:hypothetical protein